VLKVVNPPVNPIVRKIDRCVFVPFLSRELIRSNPRRKLPRTFIIKVP
jgi:hypothetical protein